MCEFLEDDIMVEKTVNEKINKVFNFYKSLPQEMKEAIFAIFCDDINRKSRRAIERGKSIDDKIAYSLQHMRETFANAAYETYKEKVDLSLRSSKYEDIIANINDENKLYYTIFFFRWLKQTKLSRTSIPMNKK